jgi:Holliday junction resolvase RusA-like endonuclease
MKRLNSFEVLGDPKAQKRHRHAKVGGFVRTYDPSQEEKANMRCVAQMFAPDAPYSEPLFVELDFYFGRPKAHFGSGKNANVIKASAPEHHTKKPDCDNCAKFVMDALTGVFWTDDALICGQMVRKHYSDRPRTRVVVYSMEGEVATND